MEEYSYIIIGVIILIFNLYRKVVKKKKAQEAAMQMQAQQPTQQQEYVEPKETLVSDFLENFEKTFLGAEDDYIPRTATVEEKVYDTPDIEDIIQKNNNQEKYEQVVEEDISENKTTIKQHITKKNKIKVNLKQAIIYNAILERKY